METIKDFKFKVIKNFLTQEEIELSKNYTIIKHRLEDKVSTDQTGGNFYYGNPFSESLLLAKRKKMQEITGLKLLPTYSFYRMYLNGSILEKHSDRPSCEISVTISLASSGEDWPIYMEGVSCSLNPGDAVVYLGCDLNHWREEFKGDYCSQCFLHYVDANGKNKKFYKDKRRLWGEGAVDLDLLFV
jgi:hypothetical protein